MSLGLIQIQSLRHLLSNTLKLIGFLLCKNITRLLIAKLWSLAELLGIARGRFFFFVAAALAFGGITGSMMEKIVVKINKK